MGKLTEQQNTPITTQFLEEYLLFKTKNYHAIDFDLLYKKIAAGIINDMKKSDLFLYIAEICATNITKHPQYGILAASCELDILYMLSADTFTGAMEEASQYIALCPKFLDFVLKNSTKINNAINNSKDSLLDYFGLKTTTKNFLLDCGKRTYERPQYMFMRVACHIHLNDVESALQTYELMSSKYFTHATPTLMRSGKLIHQLSSCFLMGSKDSVSGLSSTVKKMAKISSSGGGLAIHISNYSANGSLFRGTNHKSCGITPKLRVFNETNRCITQSNNRRGSCTIYLEPWHPEIKNFIELRKNTGAEEQRTRDLFLALWIPDLFMKRVIDNKDWSLFCPYKCPNLNNTFGKEFEELYKKYENEGRAQETIKARTLWREIIKSQIETGNPFIMYKDHVNSKSNQSNVGVIKSSNLCTEIVEYSDEKEVAVCNLASIGLPSFVEDLTDTNEEYIKDYNTEKCSFNIKNDKFFNDPKNAIHECILKVPSLNKRHVKNGKFYNLEKLYAVVKTVVKNLNRVIDLTYYPLPEAEVSNKKLRPTGLGVQGLADVFAMLHIPFESKEAAALNRDIAETIYYAALEASCELAEKYGTYEKFEGSPASKGILAFDYDKVSPKLFVFEKLKKKIKKFGLRNSLLIALMPTATTSILFNFNESTEAFPSNIFVQRTLSGDFQVINKYLLADLIKLGIWNENMKNLILFKKGSIQEIPEIPDDLKEVYKTVWEIKMKTIIDMSADRGAYVCQSQSLNLFLAQPTYEQMNAMHIYGWKKGLKTGMYYLRTMPIGSAIQFTVDRKVAKKKLKDEKEDLSSAPSSCSLADEECISCGS